MGLLIAVQVNRMMKVEYILAPNIHDIIDYLMMGILLIQWMYVLMYFLVIRWISHLLLSLYSMIEDTISFIFIVSCFIMIMASLFTTLYQDTN